MSNYCSRRTFLHDGIASLAALSLCIGCSPRKTDTAPVSLGLLDAIPPGDADFTLLRLRLFHALEGNTHLLSALSLVCPHQGCVVQAAGNGFVCPCHGAAFSTDGALERGPARRSLRWIALELSPAGELLAYLQKEVDPQWKLRVVR